MASCPTCSPSASTTRARTADDFFDAAQNARLVAERRAVLPRHVLRLGRRRGTCATSTCSRRSADCSAYRGPDAKAVVWEHNSHIGDASATEMGARGEHNVGQLCRRAFGDDAFLVGFGTDHGTVAAAADWDGPMEVKAVRPSHARTATSGCATTSGSRPFMLDLREPARAEVRDELAAPRLERAIGVIYRPETELQSHYFQALLPRQFDEYVWFDESTAVTPLPAHELAEAPETYPFGL